MGYRQHIYIDDEIKDIIDKIPEKKRSEYFRTAVKSFELQKSQPPPVKEPPVYIIRRHEN